jgi:hypothetical protein
MWRSGSTVQYQITAQLVEDAGKGKRVGWVEPDRFPEIREKYADYDGWKVFKAHVCTDAMISEFERQNAMGVYIFRDIRDVFVSTMNKNSTMFQQEWNGGLLERCLDNYWKWTSLPRVMVSKYEEVIRDLPGEVERIAVHLGIPLDRKKCEQIASEYTIQKQWERIKRAKGKLTQGQVKGEVFDPHSLLHTNHINSGEIGKWKSQLSKEQVAMIEEKAKDWLVKNGYELACTRSNILKRILSKFI